MIATFGLSFAAASILWTEGARFLPASESGLLGAAEVPLAILFAWLILANCRRSKASSAAPSCLSPCLRMRGGT